MVRTARHPIPGTYRVEVSGWDSAHSFFVEQTELEWSEESGKEITLGHRLHSAAMIFVRLLHPTAPDLASPVAYRAEPIASMAGGRYRLRLSQVVPRTNSN